MVWPIYYPDRPAIPYDDLPDNRYQNLKRQTRWHAEAGKRPGRPVKRLPLYRMKKKPEPPEVVA